MKKMNRIMALILAGALAGSTPVTVFAAEDAPEQEADITVTAAADVLADTGAEEIEVLADSSVSELSDPDEGEQYTVEENETIVSDETPETYPEVESVPADDIAAEPAAAEQAIVSEETGTQSSEVHELIEAADPLVEAEISVETEETDEETIEEFDLEEELADDLQVPDDAEIEQAEISGARRASAATAAAYNTRYGNQLSGLARELYNGFVNYYATQKQTGNYQYTLKDVLTFTAEKDSSGVLNLTGSASYTSVKKQMSVGMQNALDAFRYDYPEVFWIGGCAFSYSVSYSAATKQGRISSITLKPRELVSGLSAKMSQYDTAVSKAVSRIRAAAGSTGNRDDIIKAIHDYVCGSMYYNASAGEIIYSSAASFLSDGGSVCEGYAKTFKVLCDAFSIPCACVGGVANTPSGSDLPHMWNYVQMANGSWYLIDATWDDQAAAVLDTYFLSGWNSDGFYQKISAERAERGSFSTSGTVNYKYPKLSNNGFGTLHKASITGITSKTYTGKALTQSPTVKVYGKTLTNGTDYTLSYKNNTQVGTATVTLTGKGSYSGTVTRTFKITAPAATTKTTTTTTTKTTTTTTTTATKTTTTTAVKTTVKKVTPAVTLSKTAFTYNGKVQKPSVTVKVSGKKLAASGYTVTFSSGCKAVGTYKVTVKLKGSYSGSKTVTYKINPKGTSLSKVTAGSRSFTAKWNKQATQTSGYQLQYATSKNFKTNCKTVTISGTKTTGKTISKLTKGKTYYVRIRTYKTIGGTRYVSGWSAAKQVKAK